MILTKRKSVIAGPSNGTGEGVAHSKRCLLYTSDNNTLTADWEPLFINMSDGSNEGIKHKKNPWFSAQFHPEAASGPTDTEFLFDEFVNLLK